MNIIVLIHNCISTVSYKVLLRIVFQVMLLATRGKVFLVLVNWYKEDLDGGFGTGKKSRSSMIDGFLQI